MYTVMIVDDEKAIRENLAGLMPLEAEGFSLCATAVNGEDALHKLEEFEVDLVLLDVSMPVMDGIGFMKELRRGPHRDVEVVILSGYSEFEYAKAAMRYGARAYLTKPVDEDEAVAILREVKRELDGKRKQQSLTTLQDCVKAVKHLYRGRSADTKALESCFLLHCAVQSGMKEISVNVLREFLREKTEEAESGLIRFRGSVYTYLFSKSVLKEYRGEVSIFARHILYGLKKAGITAAVLVDTDIFSEKKTVFRKTFDSHLYEMLTEVFYGASGCMIYDAQLTAAEKEARISCEEQFLTGLKKAMAELRWEEVQEWLRILFDEIEEKKIRIEYLQEISYRIYYLLVDLTGEAESREEKRRMSYAVDWREMHQFIGFEEWKAQQTERIRLTYEKMESVRKNSGMGVVGEVMAYARQHYREPVSIRQVAELFYVNAAYLGRVFQKSVGVGFKQYVNDLRMEEAKRLLRQTDLRIYEIAQQIGFSESKYFIAKFTETVGESPSEYRKRRGEKE